MSPEASRTNNDKSTPTIDIFRSKYTKTAVAGVGLVAVGLFALNKLSAQTEVEISAEAVIDRISLPASLNVLEINGGSRSLTEINFSAGLGTLLSIPVGSINVPTEVKGDAVIVMNTLKNPDDNAAKPKANNSDKIVKLKVEKIDNTQRLVVEVDPRAFEVNKQNMRTLSTSSIGTTGLVGVTRSLPPNLAEQISTGSVTWNEANFAVGCSQEISDKKLPQSGSTVLEAGIAKAVSSIMQTTQEATAKAVIDSLPEGVDEEAVVEQVKGKLTKLSDMANITVKFVKDNQQFGITDIPYMQVSPPDEMDMIRLIGLKEDKLTVSDIDVSCKVGSVAQASIEESDKLLAVTNGGSGNG